MAGSGRWTPYLRRVVAGGAAGLLAATLGTSGTQAQVVTHPPHISRVGVAPDGYSLGDPSVLMTRSGAVLIAWNEYLSDPNAIEMTRKKPGGSFAAVTVPQAGLVSFGDAYLTEDTINDRILLTAEAHGATLDDLGLYVWTSTNNGATWSQPVRVWDSFASGQIAMDRQGGFWAITDQTWAVVAHVPSTLDMQHWPDDHVVLSDRFASRGAIDLATTGSSGRLLFAWGDGANEAWVHVGSAAGQADDARLMTGLYADGAVKLAGDRFGAVLGGIRQVATPSGNTRRLFASGIVALKDSTDLFRPVLVSSKREDVVDFAVTCTISHKGKPTGLFAMAWLNSDGRLRTAHSTSRGNPTWSKPRTVLTFPTQGYSFPSDPDMANGGWIGMHAYGKTGRESEIVLRSR